MAKRSSRVGSRELKTRLGSYLQRVRRGEIIVVTDRGEPVAELRPIHTSGDAAEDALRRMAAEGLLTRPTHRRGLRPFKPIKLPPGLSAAELISEDREDRFWVRFFDASAVVAAYLDEPDRTRARRLLGRRDVVVSRLTEVEAASAFSRLVRETVLTPAQRDAATAVFLDDLAGWEIVEVTQEVTARARALLVRHLLRAGDAIQLASALLVQERAIQPLEEFVTSDRRLLDAARAEQLTVSP